MTTNTVAIVQARIGSTRLPGKILKPLAGKPALWHVVNRLKYSKLLDDVVVATTTSPEDDVVEKLCRENDFKCFRGSEDDVLDRYYQAAKMYGADPIIRITADCPVIDPIIVDEVIAGFFEGGYDIYDLGGEYPDGLDCGLFAFRVLEDLWKNTSLPSDREHIGVTYIKNYPEKYKSGHYEKFKGLSHHRWTLDEEADLRFLQAIYDHLYRPGQIFLTEDILDLLDREPYLMEINSGIIRNEGYLKSLKADKSFLHQKSDKK